VTRPGRAAPRMRRTDDDASFTGIGFRRASSSRVYVVADGGCIDARALTSSQGGAEIFVPVSEAVGGGLHSVTVVAGIGHERLWARDLPGHRSDQSGRQRDHRRRDPGAQPCTTSTSVPSNQASRTRHATVRREPRISALDGCPFRRDNRATHATSPDSCARGDREWDPGRARHCGAFVYLWLAAPNKDGWTLPITRGSEDNDFLDAPGGCARCQ
jgi:hypothetical protein